MEKSMLLAVIAGVLMIGIAYGAQLNTTDSSYFSSDTSYVKVNLVNQDPYPADPGSYVDLVFKVENYGAKPASNLVFSVNPSYPFSLDPGVSAEQQIGYLGPLETGSNAYLVRYKVKVDNGAVNGENEIIVNYTFGNGLVSRVQSFNVSVSNPRTDFDVVMQDYSSGAATLAIANIGANTAYSVIVSIPSQRSVLVSGSSATVIGNVNAGDYTLTSFSIASSSGNSSGMPFNGTMPADFPDRTNRTSFNSTRAGGSGNLTVSIAYTDTLGIRRTVEKQVAMSLLSGSSVSSFQRTAQTTSTSGGIGLNYILIGAGGIIIVVAFFRFWGRKKKCGEGKKNEVK